MHAPLRPFNPQFGSYHPASIGFNEFNPRFRLAAINDPERISCFNVAFPRELMS